MPTTTNQSRRDGEATRQRLLRAALDLYTTIAARLVRGGRHEHKLTIARAG
jgi:hypothetical protein